MEFKVDSVVLGHCEETRKIEVLNALDELNTQPDVTLCNPVDKPWNVLLADYDGSGLTFAVISEDDSRLGEHRILWASLRTSFKEYREVIENILGTGFGGSESRFQALDYGKKVVHDEAGEAIQELLEDLVEMDLATARRLFTFIFLLRTKLPVDLIQYHRSHL